MATKFYLAEIPDDFPATNVKFENMTKPLLAIPPKMVDGKPITIVGYIDAGQKKYKANDYGFVEFNDNGADFAQFKDANMDTRYSVREKVSGDILGYLPLETGELVGIVREKEKPILLLIIAVIAALVLLVALITASLYKMVNKPLDGSGSDASSASSEIVIADGEAYDGTMDNGKTENGLVILRLAEWRNYKQLCGFRDTDSRQLEGYSYIFLHDVIMPNSKGCENL